MKKIKILFIFCFIFLIICFIGAWVKVLFFSDFGESAKFVSCTQEAKICPDGSSVSRVEPNCDFAECPSFESYINSEYGFEIKFSNSWHGYSVEKNKWIGSVINNKKNLTDYSGVELVFINPQTNISAGVKYQDIPIMIFTKNVWEMIEQEEVAVSAAPIIPEKIGENSDYIFATPPRWYGFTDDIGFEEAIKIVKTFKAFDIK